MTTFPWRHRGDRQSAAGTAPAGAAPKPAVEPFWQVLGLGLITVLFGIAVLAWPSHTLHLVGGLVGIWLLVAGALRLVGAFGHQQTAGRRVLLGVVGVLLVVGGVACLRNVATGVAVLASIIGLAWLLSGMAEMVVGFLARGAVRAWLVTLGVASLLVGLAFLVWPGLSLGAMVLLTGITALIIGTAEVAFAFQLKKGSAAVRPASPAEQQAEQQ